jgi:phage host-nuclease inhibitor protein Gam
MLLNEKSKFTDREIIEKGSKALIKELGYSGFLRFIRHSEGISKEDYLNIEDEIFNDMPLDDIYDKAKEHWENRQ